MSHSGIYLDKGVQSTDFSRAFAVAFSKLVSLCPSPFALRLWPLVSDLRCPNSDLAGPEGCVRQLRSCQHHEEQPLPRPSTVTRRDQRASFALQGNRRSLLIWTVATRSRNTARCRL